MEKSEAICFIDVWRMYINAEKEPTERLSWPLLRNEPYTDNMVIIIQARLFSFILFNPLA